MKKILLAITLTLFSYSVQSALPKKYVRIASYDGGSIVYGNIEDNYGNGSAWIVINRKDGRSEIRRIIANCGNNLYSIRDGVVYAKHNLNGEVLVSRSIVSFNERVIPDTIGEAQYEFACYGIY